MSASNEGTAPQWKSPLYEMTQTTPTVLWNDSAAISELTYSIEHGAVGATCNPVIVLDVLKKDMATWKPEVARLIAQHPSATEDQIAWMLVDLLSVRAAELLMPAFEKHKGRNGRLSVQTDPRFFCNQDALVEQAVHFSALAPNIIVKIPATSVGIPAMEEATYRGVSINATVSFTLPQALAVAEAIERGLKRREKEGKDIATMGPVCTIMVGRLDDWLRTCTQKEGTIVDPGILEWAGVAVFKKAYRIYQERGYRLRLLSAAFRNHMHWSEFIGGDVVISPPLPLAEADQRQRRHRREPDRQAGGAQDPGRPAQALSRFRPGLQRGRPHPGRDGPLRLHRGHPAPVPGGGRRSERHHPRNHGPARGLAAARAPSFRPPREVSHERIPAKTQDVHRWRLA